MNKEDLKRLIKMLEGVKEQQKRLGHSTKGIQLSINEFNEGLKKYEKARRPPTPQPKRGGVQYVAGGHVFVKDRYRPFKAEIFDGARENHLGPTCMDCGKHQCEGCFPEFLTEKCPGPKDVWPSA